MPLPQDGRHPQQPRVVREAEDWALVGGARHLHQGHLPGVAPGPLHGRGHAPRPVAAADQLLLQLRQAPLQAHWTLGHSTVQWLDSWKQHCPMIGQLETALSNLWTVRHSSVQPFDSLTHHCLTNGQLDRFRVFSKPKLSDGRPFV